MMDQIYISAIAAILFVLISTVQGYSITGMSCSSDRYSSASSCSAL